MKHRFLHRIEGSRAAGNTVAELRSTPVLLNEVQLTVVFWIEITQVATRFDELLELWLLRCEIRLCKENAPAAAAGLPFTLRAFEAGAFATQPICGPKATLTDDLFHSLEPTWVKGVVVWEIERLWRAGERVDAIADAWPVRYGCPATFGSFEGTMLRQI